MAQRQLQEWYLPGHRPHLDYLHTADTIQCPTGSGNAGRVLKGQLFQSLYFMGGEPRSKGEESCEVTGAAKASGQAPCSAARALFSILQFSPLHLGGLSYHHPGSEPTEKGLGSPSPKEEPANTAPAPTCQ